MDDITSRQTAKQFKWVGTRPVRPDGVPKVTGRALYGSDLAMPGMLVGRVLRSPHAHARIRSLDTAKAAALPGVKAVVTKSFERIHAQPMKSIIQRSKANEWSLLA